MNVRTFLEYSQYRINGKIEKFEFSEPWWGGGGGGLCLFLHIKCLKAIVSKSKICRVSY